MTTSARKHPAGRPHKLTLSLTPEQYEALRKLSYESRKPMNGIVYGAIDDYLAEQEASR